MELIKRIPSWHTLIVPRNLKISAQSDVVAGVLESSLEFVPEISGKSMFMIS